MFRLSHLYLHLVFIFCLLASVNSLAAKGKKGSSGRSSGGGFGAKQSSIVHTPDNSDSTERLLQFLDVQKARGLENVEIGYAPETGVRGLFVTKNFKKGQLMCQIPSDCALALSDPSKNGVDAPTLAHGGANFLNMYSKPANARQLWHPYLDTLPEMGSKQFDPTPDFFSDDELELLEFPRLIRQAKQRREDVERVAIEQNIDVSDLQFATWLTASRAFCISMTSSEDQENEEDAPKFDDRGQVIIKAGQKKLIRVLVPFIDMANHSSDQPNAKLTLIDPEKDDAWFALEATRPISAGKEILISYGSGVESSVELFLNYGFVPHANKIDEFMLKKGGEECLARLADWTTSLDEDRTMLSMVQDGEDEDSTLQKILKFRIRLKESYSTEKE